MSRDDSYGVGQAKLLHQTEMALFVVIEGVGKVWIPKSVIHDDSEIYEECENGDEGELVVKSWFAEQEG